MDRITFNKESGIGLFHIKIGQNNVIFSGKITGQICCESCLARAAFSAGNSDFNIIPG